MMKKQFGLLLLFVFFGIGCTVLAQRGGGGSNPTVTVVPIISHATCFYPEGSIEYEVVVSSNWKNEATLNSIKLMDHGNPVQVVYQDGGPSLTGSITSLLVGGYTLSGSVTALNSAGMWVGIPFSATIWLGIETVWSEKIDMISLPNSYSAKRNVTSNSFGGVRSSNGITSGDGWIEMKAQYGTTTNSHVYWIVGETNPLGTFTASDPIQFIEFYQTSSGNGIRVKYENFGGNFVYANVSTNPNDKVRLMRSGTNMKIQLNNSTSTTFMFQAASSGPMNIAVRTQEIDDGCLDVVSSFPCRSEVYAKVERKLRGVKYAPIGNSLKFYVSEEYDNQSGDLEYRVYADLDRVNPVLSGTQQVHSIVYGDNRYDLDVIGLSSGPYILEVINEKKEKFYLRFVKP